MKCVRVKKKGDEIERDTYLYVRGEEYAESTLLQSLKRMTREEHCSSSTASCARKDVCMHVFATSFDINVVCRNAIFLRELIAWRLHHAEPSIFCIH